MKKIRPTEFVWKLNRKHCRMLARLLTRHVDMNYMLHKMETVKSPSSRKCGAEKETSVYILRECSALERVRRKTLGRARMEPDQIKEVRLSRIIALSKGARILYGPLE